MVQLLIDLSSGQMKSLVTLGIVVIILIPLIVFGKRGSGSDTDKTSDWDLDDFDVD